MSLFKPLQPIAYRDHTRPSIFLGGTIDDGNSEDWQSELSKFLIEDGYTVFNPRRDNWVPSIQSDNSELYAQINWEFTAMNEANCILIYFAENSKSPISLLELGLFAPTKKVKVVCHPNFWRKTNVEVICAIMGIPMFKSLDEFKENLDVF